jgi:MFS transporter, SP family, arabinose:H+ symporter
MVGFSFFITSFAIGVGGTGWLIQGEVFPTSVRGRAAATAACVGPTPPEPALEVA